MVQMNPLVQVIVGISGLFVSAGIPIFIFQFTSFKAVMRDLKNELNKKIDELSRDLKEQNKKMDQHISNYDIHFNK